MQKLEALRSLAMRLRQDPIMRWTLSIPLVAIVACGPAKEGSRAPNRSPQAAPVAPSRMVEPTFRAKGNEPFWSLEISDSAMVFKQVSGSTITVRVPRTITVAGGRGYTGSAGEQELSARILDRPCVDDMSGMRYPNSVTVMAGGKELHGCGGTPADTAARP